MDLALIDLLILGAYAALLFYIGFSYAKTDMQDENYLLAARKMTLPSFVMTLVTTWYGLILGVGEFIFGFGLVGWVVNGLMWYGVYFLFAFVLAKRLQKSKQVTVADQMRLNIGPKSAALAGVITFIMTSPAPYILSLAVLLNQLFGLDLWLSVGLGLFVSAAYIWTGGFKAVTRTDAIQFVFMYLGFGALLLFSFLHFGGWAFLSANLPETHLTFTGELGWPTIIVWGLIAFWTFVDPNFYQRCYAAKDAQTAKKGILISIVLWFVFDMLTLFTGLYARAAFPEADALFSYLVLSDAVLPVAIKGIFLVGVLSIIMSTIDSFLFASSSIVSKDFLQARFPKKSMKSLTRWGILVTLLAALVFIAIFQSIIGIVYSLGTMGVSMLLLPMLLSMFAPRLKLTDGASVLSMVLAGLASGAWLVEGWLHAEYGWPVYRWALEPMYIGLAASGLVLAVFAASRWLSRP
jgi:SSS family solute:Na+ symporter